MFLRIWPWFRDPIKPGRVSPFLGFAQRRHCDSAGAFLREAAAVLKTPLGGFDFPPRVPWGTPRVEIVPSLP